MNDPLGGGKVEWFNFGWVWGSADRFTDTQCAWNQKVSKVWPGGKLFGKLTLGYVLSTSDKPKILRSGPFRDIKV